MSRSNIRRPAAAALLLAAAMTASSAQAAVYFQESFAAPFFDELNNPPSGWFVQNNSAPAGTISWFQGNPNVFGSFNGEPNGYLGVNFNSGSGVSTINNWMVTPVIDAPAGTRVSFVTRAPNNAFPDRLELRAANGDTTNVGTTSTDVGDFTNLLVSVNPGLLPEYPLTWTRFEVTLPAAFNGRFAFRYFVTNGGPLGENSNYIGIDAFHVSDPSEPLPEGNPPPPPPVAANTTVGGSLTDTLDFLSQIKWYTFDHSGGPFLVNTNGSSLSGDNDTELGLYDAAGSLLISDDDSGDGFLSQISLSNLAAGKYYLAIGGWNVIFGASDWAVTSTGASGDTGTFVINGLTFAPDVPAYVLGDFNFDGGLDGSDVDPFVLALSDLQAFLADFADAFATLYPGMTLDESVVDVIGDFNDDGGFDGSDVDGFVEALSNGRPGVDGARPGRGLGLAPIPEPTALGLLAPTGLLLSRRRR